MKAHRDSGGTTPPILNLGTRWKWAVSLTPRPLYYQETSPQDPRIKELGGTRASLSNYENG